jgi:general secretion pathway protein A
VYESYWGLREKPFRKTPDPRYIFLNDVYEEALERLLFAVEEMELALLTGEVGSGKTLLTRALVDRLGNRYEVGMILNPRLSPRQFLRVAARELGVAEPRFHSNDLLEQIHERLLELDAQGRAALLIVDEAHLIPGKPTFEEIRLLTNFQLDDRNLVAIVLVGQPELRQRLRHRAYRALTQRIGVSFDLEPLAAEDAHRYLAHRLGVAGADRPIFTGEAARRLHAAAGGVPRVLNQLATQALLEGMARGASCVDGVVAEAVAGERDWDGPPRGREGRDHGSNGRRAEEGPAWGHRRRGRHGRDGALPGRGGAAPLGAGRGRARAPRGGAPAPPSPEPAAPAPVVLPASGLAEDVLGREETAGAHSLSFFAAPVREQRAAAEATEHLATFFLDREEYGVDVRQVQEIRRTTEITAVPRAPGFVRGVINLRGRILPVLDLKRKLGLGDVEAGRATRIVVVRLGERLLGLLVDGASQVLKVEVSRIEPPPRRWSRRAATTSGGWPSSTTG